MREIKPAQGRPRCPFYGFQWPARSSNLIETGTPECGLDLDEHGLCLMELEHKTVDFEGCARRSEWKNLIEAGKHYIRFCGSGMPDDGVPLERWQHMVMRQE